MTDTEILDWLQENPERLREVYYRHTSSGESDLRKSIEDSRTAAEQVRLVKESLRS